VESDEVIEIPKMRMFRDGNRQRIVVEKDGQVVEDNTFEIPEWEGFKEPMVWNWTGEDGEMGKAFKVSRPGSRAEVERLRAEIDRLRRQVDEMERQLGRTPKPKVSTAPKTAQPTPAPKATAQPTPAPKAQ
jgi:hypothetical protein